MLTVFDLPSIDQLESMVIKTQCDTTKRAIRWPYVAEDSQLKPWLKGGEVLFVTGINRQWDDDEFQQLIDVANECHASAIVVLTGSKHIPFLPPRWIQLCEQALMPLLEQPYSLPMVTVTERLSNAIIQDGFAQRSKQWFIQQLLESNTTLQPMALAQAKELALSDDVPLTVAMVLPLDEHHTAKDSHRYILREWLVRYDSRFPVTDYRGGWILVIPTNNLSHTQHGPKSIWHALHTQLLNQALPVAIGISDGANLTQLNRLGYQAKQCAEFAAKYPNQPIYHYRALGLQQVFAAIDDDSIKYDFCSRYLGPLFHTEKRDLVTIKHTLLTYFSQLGSLRKTAASLGVHRNTITSRLSRFETLTGQLINDPTHRLAIQNALMMEPFLTPNQTPYKDDYENY